MNTDYLSHVMQVKESLIIWQSNVEQIHNGIQMFSNENELDRNNTDFAKWYYNEGQVFSSFETFKVLGGLYDVMYDVFLEYDQLKKSPVKKSLFSNNTEKRKNELGKLYNDLKQKTRKLIKSVEIFEENLKNSPLFTTTETSQALDLEIEKPFKSEVEENNTTELSNKELAEKLLDNNPEFVTNEAQNIEEEVISKKKEELSSEEIIKLEIEKRLQEEVKKIREELKKELLQEKNQSEQVIESKEIDKVQQQDTTDNLDNTTFKPKIKSSNDLPDLDIDEEIRRILS